MKVFPGNIDGQHGTRVTHALHLLVAWLILAGCGWMGCTSAGAATSNWMFIQNGPESHGDQRYDYHWLVLKAALDATRPSYGDYSVAWSTYMNESRQIAEMKKEKGLINTLVLDSTAQLERDLIAVKVPVDKGLLGYRVFLIRAEDQPKFDAVRTIDDLRKFTIGQASDWSDVAVYKSAGFNVVGATRYESLFDMLMHGRFDAFGRGVAEVVDELAAHQGKYPNMAIEQTTLLYYPMAVYFWFPKTSEGALRAKRVADGMDLIAKNGTFERLFKEHFGPIINQLQVKKRRLFRIENPQLPPDQPFGDKSLWFDPLR